MMPKSSRKVNNKNKGQGGIRSLRTDIPVTSAYTLKNNQQSTKSVNIRGSEFITGMKIHTTTPLGTLWKYALNPVNDLYQATRMRNIASSYNKYRFRHATLRIASNFSTTVGGNIVAGFSENPNIQLLSGEAVFNQLWALDGISTSLYTPASITAKIADKTKWYNVDEDANVNELMNTTQGVFYVALQSAITATGELSIPLILEYDIEFKENALQSDRSTFGGIHAWGEVTLEQRAEETRGQYHVSTGDALDLNVIYKIIDGVTIVTRDGPVMATWVAHFDNKNLSHGFYQTRQDCINAINPIVAHVNTSETFTIGPLKLTPLN